MDDVPLTVAAAELERKRLTSLINSMADGVIAIDSRYQVVIYNGAALNILNINTTITNQPINSVLRLLDKKGQPVDTLEVIKNAKVSFSSRDNAIRYQDGSLVKLYLSIAPVHLGYGSEGARGYVLLLRDITREKSLEEERDEFISVASHELRTPVAIAEGNISNARLMLQKGNDPKLLEHALKQAYDQVIFLSSLINDLSTLARAEGGRLQLSIDDVNAHDLIESLVASYKPEAEAKNLQIAVQIDPTLEVIKSSQLYLREILQNFITNAIKYTEKGTITLGANKAMGAINFWVQDSGIGISKTDQEKVFTKFFRSEDFRTRQSKGTGLGLYVTMKLAKLIRGEIHVESELNKGSRFTIFVPNLAVPEPQVQLG